MNSTIYNRTQKDEAPSVLFGLVVLDYCHSNPSRIFAPPPRAEAARVHRAPTRLPRNGDLCHWSERTRQARPSRFMPTLTLVCTIHGPDLASDGALPDVSCAPVHGRRTALQTWASRKPRRLRLDGQGRDVERSRLADEGAELASVRLQRLVRKGERLSRDVAPKSTMKTRQFSLLEFSL